MLALPSRLRVLDPQPAGHPPIPSGFRWARFTIGERRHRVAWDVDGELVSGPVNFDTGAFELAVVGPAAPPAHLDWPPPRWPGFYWPVGPHPAWLLSWGAFAECCTAPDIAEVVGYKVRPTDWCFGWLTVAQSARVLAAHFGSVGRDRLTESPPRNRELARAEIRSLVTAVINGHKHPPGGQLVRVETPKNRTGPKVKEWTRAEAEVVRRWFAPGNSGYSSKAALCKALNEDEFRIAVRHVKKVIETEGKRRQRAKRPARPR